MENAVNHVKTQSNSGAPIECPPVGCGFFIVCWLVAAEEVPEEIIWFCMGKMKNEPFQDVPMGVWAYRPASADLLELGNG